MKKYRFVVVVEKNKDGYYAFCPQLQGCYTQGDTFEEAMDNIRDAIKLHVEDRLAENEAEDIRILAERNDEPTSSFEEVEARLKARGLL